MLAAYALSPTRMKTAAIRATAVVIMFLEALLDLPEVRTLPDDTGRAPVIGILTDGISIVMVFVISKVSVISASSYRPGGLSIVCVMNLQFFDYPELGAPGSRIDFQFFL